MKKKTAILFILLVALACIACTGAAAEEKADGIAEYKLIYKDTAQTIVSGVQNLNGYYPMAITFPSQVVEIADDAFSGVSIDSITFNEGLKKIGENAFKNNPTLKNIVFPSTLEHLGRWSFGSLSRLEFVDLTRCKSIDAGYAFSGCRALRYVYFAENMSYLSSAYMFEKCGTSGNPLYVSMPKTIENFAFGNSMFAYTEGLDTITLPNTIGSHCSQMFEYARLKEITIPETITSLPYAMFRGNVTLETVTAPGVISVSGSFEGCYSLKEVTLGCGTGLVCGLGSNAFTNCYQLTTFRLANAPIEASIQIRGTNAFSGCKALKSLNYPICENIPGSAFSDSGLTEITLDPTVKSIADDAFSGTSLTRIKGWKNSYAQHYAEKSGIGWETLSSPLKAFVTNVEGYVITFSITHDAAISVRNHQVKVLLDDKQLGQSFYAATLSDNSISAMIPNPQKGKKYTFHIYGYTTWKDENGNNQICEIGETTKEYTYQGDAPVGELPDVVTSLLLDGSTYIVSNLEAAFSQTEDPTASSVTIPATVTDENGKTYKVTSIANNACKGMKNLTTVTIGKNVKTIGKNAFASCVRLSTVKTASGVVTIKDGAFSGCKALKTVPAFDKLQTIGANAFKGCVKLSKFTLAKGVKSIGKNAFNGCKALKTITVKTEKLTSSNVKAGAFKGISKKAVFKCPKKKIKEYKKLFVKAGAPKTAKFK